MPVTKGHTALFVSKLKDWMNDIMYGKEQHEWGVVVDEELR